MATKTLARPLRRPGYHGPNPVLVKELRSRFRGPRAFVALTAFLLVLAAFAGLLYAMQVGRYQGSSYLYGGRSSASELGQMLFATIAFVELACMAFIGPALTMNAISGEVERQTYDLLLATPLSGWAILRGKVGAAMAYVLLMIFSAVPLISLAFIFGGVSAGQMAASQISIFVSGLLFLMIGVFYSSLTQRTARSSVLSYITVAAVCLMPFVIFFVLGEILETAGREEVFDYLLRATPVMSLISAVFLTPPSQNATEGIFWAQATSLHALVAALLYVLAGARIRRGGRGAVKAVFAIAFFFGLWFTWTVADPAVPFP